MILQDKYSLFVSNKPTFSGKEPMLEWTKFIHEASGPERSVDAQTLVCNLTNTGCRETLSSYVEMVNTLGHSLYDLYITIYAENSGFVKSPEISPAELEEFARVWGIHFGTTSFAYEKHGYNTYFVKNGVREFIVMRRATASGGGYFNRMVVSHLYLILTSDEIVKSYIKNYDGITGKTRDVSPINNVSKDILENLSWAGGGLWHSIYFYGRARGFLSGSVYSPNGVVNYMADQAKEDAGFRNCLLNYLGDIPNGKKAFLTSNVKKLKEAVDSFDKWQEQKLADEKVKKDHLDSLLKQREEQAKAREERVHQNRVQGGIRAAETRRRNQLTPEVTIVTSTISTTTTTTNNDNVVYPPYPDFRWR